MFERLLAITLDGDVQGQEITDSHFSLSGHIATLIGEEGKREIEAVVGEVANRAVAKGGAEHN